MHFDIFTMTIEKLNLEVTVEVMLPDGYYDSDERYPVLYINDGQYIFRDNDELEEKISLGYEMYYKDYKEFLSNLILVAIHAPVDRQRRTKLYTPYEKVFESNLEKGAETYIKGEGVDYLNWMATTLREHINKEYRTLTEPQYTGIFGFSTGALSAIYALLNYPHCFFRAIAMSTAAQIWWDKLSSTLENSDCSHVERLYIDVGTDEYGRISTKEDFLLGTQNIYNYFLEKGVDEAKIQYTIHQDLQHKNSHWRLRLPDSIRWGMKKIGHI